MSLIIYRWLHVDFATIKGIETWKILPFIISSYDVNCQHGKNFLDRISDWVNISGLPIFRRCVPKYHLIGHKEALSRFANFLPVTCDITCHSHTCHSHMSHMSQSHVTPVTVTCHTCHSHMSQSHMSHVTDLVSHRTVMCHPSGLISARLC